MTVARSLAQLLTRTSFQELPPLAVERAAMLISSTVASAAAGCGISSSQIIRGIVKDQGGTPESTIWFDGGTKLPAANAARINALMSDAAASDDSNLRNTTHIGTIVAATSLAIGERTGADGKAVLAAIVLGYEAASRIGQAVTPGYKDRGFHGCILTIFGGAVASGLLLKLNEQQMAQAIAITAVSMGGLRVAAETSVAREYFAGNAAMLGINAALAAQRGFIAEEAVLEAPKGFFDTYGSGKPESIIRNWGAEWDIITHIAIKLAPGGHQYHTLGEAAASAAREGNVSPDNVESISMAPLTHGKTAVKPLPQPSHPKDLIGAAHTPAYFVAAGIADKDFSWIHASEEKIQDPVIHRLIDRIIVGQPLADGANRSMHGATVTIKTRDGRNYTSTIYAPKGSGARGIEWADVDHKYRSLVALTKLSMKKIDDGIGVIHGFGDVKNVSELTHLLH